MLKCQNYLIEAGKSYYVKHSKHRTTLWEKSTF